MPLEPTRGRPFSRSSSWIATFAGLAILGLLSRPAGADAEESRTEPTEMEVSLQECIAAAMVNNLSLRAERIRNETSALEIMASYGSFDPVVFSSGSHTDFESPTSSSLDVLNKGGEVTNQVILGVVRGEASSFELGIRDRLFTGLTTEIKFSENRSSSSRAFETLNPRFDSNLGISVTQPLLRGAGEAFNLAAVRTAKTNLRITNQEVLQSVNETIFSVIEAYWNLNFAEQDIRVKEESLQLAKNEVRVTDSKVQSGLWAQLELDQAKTEEFSRSADLVQAKKIFEDSKDVLRNLMFPMGDTEEWDIELITTDKLKEVDPEERERWINRQLIPDWRDEVRIALDRRPEINRLRLDIINREIELKRSRNQHLPTIDLTGSYEWNTLSPELEESARDVWFADPRTWSAGFTFEFPLGNRESQAAYYQAKLERRRAQILLKDQENQITVEIRESVRALEAAVERIVYSHSAFQSAEKQLSAAKSRRDRGFLTNFEVLEFQRDLAQVDQDLNEAWKEFRMARARLQRAKGTLVEDHDVLIEIDDALDP